VGPVTLGVDLSRELILDRSYPPGARTTYRTRIVARAVAGPSVEGAVEWTLPEIVGSELTAGFLPDRLCIDAGGVVLQDPFGRIGFV